MARRIVPILAVVAVAAFALGGGVVLRQMMDGRMPAAAANVAVELGAPFSLIDQNGETITEAAFQGRPTLLFFGFAHCPEVCPTTVYDMESWLSDLDVEPGQVGVYFVTVDPERDTPEFLRDYLAPQSDRIVGITGEPEKVWDMARSWRIYWQKRPLDDGDYTLDHFASVFVLNAEGEVADLIGFQEDPESAKAKIAAVLG